MKVIRNLGLPMLKQFLNTGGHVSEEVRMFKYLST
jgi:hypothetical protein